MRRRSKKEARAENSSHGMVFDTPNVVIEAIRQVLEAVRDPNILASSATPDVVKPAP